MVVCVEIGPAQPLPFGNPPEKGMLHGNIRPGVNNSFEQFAQFLQVLLKMLRARASASLVDFLRGLEAMGPMNWQIQSDPLQGCSCKPAIKRNHRFFSESHPESIAYVAHHLRTRHRSPTRGRVGTQGVYAIQNFLLLAGIAESLHGTAPLLGSNGSRSAPHTQGLFLK